MRILVTGAGGFVGRHVLNYLNGHDIVALDMHADTIPFASNVQAITGDISKADVLERAFRMPCDAIIHLATVPGGAAEINPALAKSVNVDATMSLVDCAANQADPPRFVFASSIAVFGKLPATPVIDTAPTGPAMLYGGHKLMMENWIACQSRRGVIEGLSLRLPGIVARPRSPSGMKSAFLSDLFHALIANEDFTMPVTQAATSWLCSVDAAARAMCHAAFGEFSRAHDITSLLMPPLRVKMSSLEAEIRRQIGPRSAKISYDQDAAIQSIFGEHPGVHAPTAKGLGFEGDANLQALVTSVLSNLESGG